MKVKELRERLMHERGAALDTRDPLAIRRAGDRYKAVASVIDDLDDEMEIDPDRLTVCLREAARALGHSVRETRELVFARQLPSHRYGKELRVPLSALL
ncbi:MAG: hypothetical protein ACYC4L_16535 [Chloroflexota bacterium]